MVSTGAKQSLYKVLYFDNRDNHFCERDPDKRQRLEKVIADLKAQLKDLILLSSNSAILRAAVNRIIYFVLSELRFFFKSFDWAYENELRVIQFDPQESDMLEVKVDEREGLPSKRYVESTKPIRPFIKKIILGPKALDPDEWVNRGAVMKAQGIDIEVHISECKYR